MNSALVIFANCLVTWTRVVIKGKSARIDCVPVDVEVIQHVQTIRLAWKEFVKVSKQLK